jgi:hypothetical protein
MQTMSTNGLALYFGTEDADTVALIRQACEKSQSLIQKHYELATPKDCRVYIMTSWLGFIFHSAPWPWKVSVAVSMPLWAFRAKKIWPLAGGWELSYGQRRAVGVKPPRLLKLADTGMGDRLFVRLENVDEKVQSIACHELTHAFTSHLRLPMWVKEGLAMVMVDKYFEKPTVRYETIELLERSSDKHNPEGGRKLRVGNEDALVNLYARGYWQTRYIEETQPDLLKELLSRRYQHDELESKIAVAYGKDPEDFWGEIHEVLVSHFKQRYEAA